MYQIYGCASRNIINYNGTLVKPISQGVTTTNLTGISGTVSLDLSITNTFYYSNLSSNFTANIINIQARANKTYTVTLIISQGSTGYLAISLQIAGVGQTILWPGGNAPTPVVNKPGTQTFTLYYSGSAWTVMSTYVSFG